MSCWLTVLGFVCELSPGLDGSPEPSLPQVSLPIFSSSSHHDGNPGVSPQPCFRNFPHSSRKSNELPGELVDGPKHPADLGGSTISGSRRGRLDRFNSELLGILTETMGIVHTSPGYRGLRALLFQRRLALACSPLQRSLFWTDSWKQGLCPTFREHGCLTQPPRACEQVDRPTPSTILAPFSP